MQNLTNTEYLSLLKLAKADAAKNGDIEDFEDDEDFEEDEDATDLEQRLENAFNAASATRFIK